MTKLLPSGLGVAAILAVLPIDALPSQKEKAPSQSVLLVEQADKNIKVLNGMPEAQLIPAMKFISVSLGVSCNYCHVSKDGQLDTAADVKETKRVARSMIKMVRDINATTFHGSAQVSCYTCHQGHGIPESAPALPVALKLPGGAQPKPAATPLLPTPDQILQKYTEAIGGESSIDKVRSVVIKGSVVNASGSSGNFEIDQAGPDKGFEIVTTQRGSRERVLNGAEGWEKNAFGVNPLSGQQLGDLRLALPMFGNLRLKNEFLKFDAPTMQKIDNHDAYLIRATRADGKLEDLYFDRDTGLLVRRVSETPSVVGMIPEEIDLADYHEVEGVRFPGTIRIQTVDSQNPISTRKADDINLTPPIEDSRFNQPK